MTRWINGLFSRRGLPAFPWGQFDVCGPDRAVVLHEADLDQQLPDAQRCNNHTHVVDELPRRRPTLAPLTDEEAVPWRRTVVAHGIT